MEKMKMMSCDIANENVVKLSKLFPECITEVIAEDGKAKKAVDFAVLNQLFNGNVTNYSTGGGGCKRMLSIYLAGQIKGKSYCESAN